MKKLSILFLIAVLGIVLWALPAGAEKIRLTDAELDGITAGVPALILVVPPVGSPVWNCCARTQLGAVGGLMPLNGTVSLSVVTIPINPKILTAVGLSASGTVPGIFFATGSILTPSGPISLGPFGIPIP